MAIGPTREEFDLAEAEIDVALLKQDWPKVSDRGWVSVFILPVNEVVKTLLKAKYLACGWARTYFLLFATRGDYSQMILCFNEECVVPTSYGYRRKEFYRKKA